MPPRTWKSLLVSQIFPAWAMGVNPRMQFILASYSPDLAKEFSNRCRSFYTSEKHKAIFGEIELRQSQAQERENVLGWKLIATSVGWVATWKWAHVLIVDDVVKNAEEASSPTYRAKVRDWYNQVLSTRKQNDKSATIICMTRWHIDDLVGRIHNLEDQMRLEGVDFEPFQVLDIQALIPNPDAQGTWTFSDKWLSYRPERFSVDYLRVEQMKDPRGFEALYMQNPIWAMGGLLNPADMMPIKLSDLDDGRKKDDIELGIGIDPALSSDSKSCDTAIVCVGRSKSTNMLYLLDLYADTVAPSIAINYLYMMIRNRENRWFRFRFVACEDVGGFNAWMVKFWQLLNESQTATGRRDFLYHYRPRGKGNKMDRIIYNLEPVISGHQMYCNSNIRPDFHAQLEKEIVEFPNSAKVDIVDALAQVVEVRGDMPRIRTHEVEVMPDHKEPSERAYELNNWFNGWLSQTIHGIII